MLTMYARTAGVIGRSWPHPPPQATCKIAFRRLINSPMPSASEFVDVVGIGVNATDTLLRLPHFPAFNSKLQVVSVRQEAGGQVASALVACRRWGLTARYVGTVGDDAAGAFQREQFHRDGVEAHLVVVEGARSQFGYILVDGRSGERTILWGRDPALAIKPEQIERSWIEHARLLHVDGHDPAAAAQAAQWARAAGIPVTADLDNVYPGIEALLEFTDHLLTTAQFPARVVGESDLLVALPVLAGRYGCQVTGATLGEQGALAWDGERFVQSPGYIVNPVDTTGAGDIFHAGYIYALLSGWDLAQRMEFACAAAALSCTRAGARGGIFALATIFEFMRTAQRREAAFPAAALARAAARHG